MSPADGRSSPKTPLVRIIDLLFWWLLDYRPDFEKHFLTLTLVTERRAFRFLGHLKNMSHYPKVSLSLLPSYLNLLDFIYSLP
jgi:hypothetical protein